MCDIDKDECKVAKIKNCITDIRGFAKYLGLKFDGRTKNRKLCENINNYLDNIEKVPDLEFDQSKIQSPSRLEGVKKSVIKIGWKYLKEPTFQYALDVAVVEKVGDIKKDKDGEEMITVYWSGEKNPTEEPLEDVIKTLETDGKKDLLDEIEKKRNPAPVIAEQTTTLEEKPKIEAPLVEEPKIQEKVAEPTVDKEEEPIVPKVDGDAKQTPTVPPSLSQLNTLSEYFKKDLKSYYKFRGNFIFEWGWLLYLQNLLGKEVICATNGHYSYTPTYEFFKKKFPKNPSRIPKPTSFPFMLQEVRFTELNGVSASVNQCFKDGARFTVVMLLIKTEAKEAHANALIFDSKYKRLTRFEPHGPGTRAYDNADCDEQIKVWIKKNKNWVYNAPINYCPTQGPQTLEARAVIKESKAFRGVKSEEKGFCVVWSWLFIHLRVVNPDATDEEIVKSLTSLSANELALKVRKYAEFITDIMNPDDTFKVGDYVMLSKKICTNDDYIGKRSCYGQIVKVSPKTLQLQTISKQISKQQVRAPPGLVKLVTDESIIYHIQKRLSAQKTFQKGDIVFVNDSPCACYGEVILQEDFLDTRRVYLRTNDNKYQHIIVDPMMLTIVSHENELKNVRNTLQNVPMEPKPFEGFNGWKAFGLLPLPDSDF